MKSILSILKHLIGGLRAPHASRLTPNESGFTLIELMMVVTVAGILVTLAEPSFHQSVLKAREAALKQNLFTMRDVIDQFRADKGQYPADLADLKNAGYLKRIPLDPFTKSDSTWQVIFDQTERGIFDVHSGSDLVALDGTAYNEW
jgi:general secretion pathway protein G